VKVYDDGQVTLYHGDCREVLAMLEPQSVDVVVADPPYGETSLVWDSTVDGWPRLVEPLLSGSGSLWCFGSLRSFMAQADEFDGWKFAQDIIWEKHNGSIFHADRFRRVHECVAQFYPKRTAWADVHKFVQTTPDATKRTVRRKERPTHAGEIADSTYTSHDGGPRLMRSVLQVRSCHGYAVHPTQKPLGILTPLIEYSSPVGGLVLDPFAGSGSTLLAAKLLGRRAIGIERREDYCQMAVQRLMQSVLPLEAAG
jgi:site-specific DNA-methyltransferase (adenine-specific)